MAKLSMINSNLSKKALIVSKKVTRDSLKKIIMDRDAPLDERMLATYKLSEMPRNSSQTRFRNRCKLSGRPRGVYRKFELSRIALRELGNFGLISGLKKASW
ncbi:MAG: 30S ribosomal protein S14 [Candidatus Pelagibacter sp.]|nr:30S ribosomal protein S14 [Candidatus Pelagibacter sp.]